MLRPAIPPGFISRKRKILTDLSVPDAEYTDLSPKGSVDEGIRDLIRDINALEGLVTTSSCAGRVSVFVEGSKKQRKPRKESKENITSPSEVFQDSGADENDFKPVNAELPSQPDHNPEDERKFAVSGGKGEGHWLYISHDRVSSDKSKKSSFHELFGLVPGDGKPVMNRADGSESGIRLVRFHFEPMVRLVVVHASICSMRKFVSSFSSFTSLILTSPISQIS
jgi:tRNA wybutosine-synthesizing protein 3